jgi:hypothetical protein
MPIRIAVAFALLAASTASLAEGPSDKDRAAALHQLERTREKFLASIAGLNEAQWKFKAAPERWSIAETAEHIIKSEGLIRGKMLEGLLKGAPATAEQKAAIKITDEALVQRLPDRSHKAKAPEALVPTGKLASRDEAAKEFEAARAESIAYVKGLTVDPRNYVAPHPAFGPLDGQQWLLLLALHSERHTLQIEEVKTAAGYPK